MKSEITATLPREHKGNNWQQDGIRLSLLYFLPKTKKMQRELTKFNDTT